MKPAELAKRLRPYGGRPVSIRDATSKRSLKGYKLAELNDAFEKYLPPIGES